MVCTYNMYDYNVCLALASRSLQLPLPWILESPVLEGENGSSNKEDMCTKDQSLCSANSNPPPGSPKSILLMVGVGTTAWKEKVEVTGIDQYHVLVDIHKALLSIHSRIDAVKNSVQQLVHFSFRVRQSTPIVSIGSDSSNSQLADESELDSCSLTPKTSNSLALYPSKLVDAPGSSDHEGLLLQATVEDMCL